MLHMMLHTYTFKLNYLFNPKFDVFRFIDLAAEAGFSGVALSGYAPQYLELSGGSPAHLERVRKRFEADGFLVDLDNASTEPELLTGMINLAERLGARVVRTFTRPPGTPAERIAKATRDLARVAPLAERAQIRIVLENHEDLTGEEIATVLRALDNPWIGAVYDYGNSMALLEEPMVCLDALLPWIYTAHLKDHVMIPAGPNGMDKPSVLGVPIGQGNIPVVEITQRLIAAGVERACFQSVWGYHIPVIDHRGGAALDQGVFTYAHPPYDPARCCVDARVRATSGGAAEICRLEEQAYWSGVAWLKQAFDRAGIELARPLKG